MNRKKMHVVLLATGGTISGLAPTAGDHLGYRAGQVGVQDLLHAAGGEDCGSPVEAHQLAQIDSKDMDLAIWQKLALHVAQHLADPAVAGVVITHGTDTMEETAYFLDAVLPQALRAAKPVVLTGSMRPASARWGDGGPNLADALRVAAQPGAHGVMLVCAGRIHAAWCVQKVHSYRLDAFDSAEAGVLGWVESGRVRWAENQAVAPVRPALIAIDSIANEVLDWPRVEIVLNHVGGSAGVVLALLQPLPGWPPLAGLVVAGTGNGTLHHALERAVHSAQAQGVRVWRSSRCVWGRVLGESAGEGAAAAGLSPTKARVALMLTLLAERSA